jgi:hypothetical protein
MSASTTPVESSGNKPVTPKRIVQFFLGTLLTLMLSTLLLGQLKLPEIGKTVWDLGIEALCALGTYLEVWIPQLVDATGDHYTVLTGAVGVFWLTHIYLRVSRTGYYSRRKLVDGVMSVLTGWLFVNYLNMDKTLPLHANFFERLALFCAISPVVFSWMVTIGHRANVNSDDEKEVHDGFMTAFVSSLVLCVAFGIVTGFHGGDTDNVSFIAFQFPNAVMHLLANFGGIAMGLWFLSLAEKPKEKKSSKTQATPAAVESNTEGAA